MWLTRSSTIPAPSSSRGLLRKSNCEDSTAAWKQGDCVFLVVADGVGRADRAADASRLAVAEVVRQSASFDVSLFSIGSHHDRLGALRDLFTRVVRSFHEAICDLSDYEQWQTTLTVAVIPDRNTVAVISQGDSTLLCEFKARDGTSSAAAGSLQPILVPQRLIDHHEHRPMTLHDSLSAATYLVADTPDLNGLVLSTDGMENLISLDLENVIVDVAFSQMIDCLRSQDFAAFHDLLTDGSEAGPTPRFDDHGVAVAAWR
jgi:serine/threonine protein phosphatase PrpC